MFLSHYHHHHLLFSNLPVPLTLTHHHSSFSHPPPSHLLHFLHRPTIIPHTISAIPPTLSSWLTELTTGTDDPSSTIQVTSTILVTGAITLFFFRTLQRRAKRAKELKFRSSGVNKSLASTSIKAKKRPSPDQALLGAIIAGVIAVILYRFTTSVEATLYRQTISDNFSDNNKRLVLPCYICLWHKFCWFIALFWSACHEHF
ncbi:uncharacterized protein LOC130738032 isoform X2 [Lotus japonicus]|uniref:uncharacterized protein LOC130738032 isoform X2 n=1 Tax=Lotus japonicus TaxID=34305 RepID=UPI00258ADBFD|nr:uncharacterized protein LOC130738032 isoform X2 [Lotus japonicus]